MGQFAANRVILGIHGRALWKVTSFSLLNPGLALGRSHSVGGPRSAPSPSGSPQKQRFMGDGAAHAQSLEARLLLPRGRPSEGPTTRTEASA